MTCLRVKHCINDLAGRLSTTRFFVQNRGMLKRPAKSFTKCLTK